MSSKSLFVKCKLCEKNLSKNAKACPHCGEKRKKLSILHWVGIVILSLFIVLLINVPDESKQKKPSFDAAEVASEIQKGARIITPINQKQFISLIEQYANSFRSAQNDLQKSVLRDQRRDELAKLINSRSVKSWIGTISKLETNSEGKAILSIKLSPNVEIKTWNNVFSDIGSDTLITKESELYSTLLNLSQGQKIVFSGDFFSSEADYIKETSITIKGSMRSPEFLFNFKSANPLD